MQRLQSLPQPIMRLVLGVTYLIVAIAFGVFGTQSARARAVWIEQLPHLDGAVNQDGKFVCTLTPAATQNVASTSPTVVQIAPGSVVLIEGQISPLNLPQYRDFISYVRDEYRGISADGSAIWREDQRATPALLIDLVGGSVRIANTDYRLDSPHQRWQDGDKLIANNIGIGGTRRYTGLTVNRPVTAIGVLENGPDGPELRSSFVFGGTRAEYIAVQIGAAAYLPWLGCFAAIIGLTLIARNLRRAEIVVPRIAVRRADGYNKWFILR
ncbi:MAG: hypothetical protein WCK70_04660 [Chloroflexales bacterium]|jgi:hypothetical protein